MKKPGRYFSSTGLFQLNPPRLTDIEDLVVDSTAEMKGFEGNGSAVATYSYDGNGNMTSDGEQGLDIFSNLINLPKLVVSGTDSLLFEYSFSGEKIRKLEKQGANVNDRIYLGGAEFLNDTLELYHHPEGRAVWRDTTRAYQYRMGDHLGNTADCAIT